MELRALTDRELKTLYKTELKRAFPPNELKPLRSMEELRAQGKYDVLGMFDGADLLGYAMLWVERDCPLALLDYLGVAEGRRGGGLGSALLGLLAEHYRDYRGVFGEAEAPENGASEEEPLRRRRLEFYRRNGFRYGGYDCALFGVRYRALLRGAADVSPRELMEAHRNFYQKRMPPDIMERYVQIPLFPGERPNPAPKWLEKES